jgi:hypothetical protein
LLLLRERDRANEDARQASSKISIGYDPPKRMVERGVSARGAKSEQRGVKGRGVRKG